MPVMSEKYQIIGKIDIYDSEKKILTERKKNIKKIYDGYRYQLYAQYLCLLEAGYQVSRLILYSLSDNKKYDVPFPTEEDINTFSEILAKIRSFDPAESHFAPNKNKCTYCIYRSLCSYHLC